MSILDHIPCDTLTEHSLDVRRETAIPPQCERCHKADALPNDDWCASCIKADTFFRNEMERDFRQAQVYGEFLDHIFGCFERRS